MAIFDNFWIVWGIFFLLIFDFVGFCFYHYYIYIYIFIFYFYFFSLSRFFLFFLSKLLRLLLKVTKVTTGHRKSPRMGQNNLISFFCCPKCKKSLGLSPPQELEVGPRSGPYLLFILNQTMWLYQN